jgi:hypothetical protein
MAEKVAKLSVTREKDFMYYVKDGAVWKVQRKQPGVPKGKSEKVADGNFQMDTDFIYFVDKDGDVSRAKRAVGGQKRKKKASPGPKKAAAASSKKKKPAKPAKKPAKPAPRKAMGKSMGKTTKKSPAKGKGKPAPKKKSRR